MMHDNYDPELERVFGSDIVNSVKTGLPIQNGLYFVYCTRNINLDYREAGLMYLRDGEWVSWPGKFSLNTAELNHKIIACIGPIPEKIE